MRMRREGERKIVSYGWVVSLARNEWFEILRVTEQMVQSLVSVNLKLQESFFFIFFRLKYKDF